MKSELITLQVYPGKEYQITNHSDILQIVQQELTVKEILQIDMRLLGKIVLAQAKILSAKVNQELLEPISAWLNDTEWMKRFQDDDKDLPDWAAYKRQSRNWTKQQKYLARERLRQYWKAIREKRLYREKLSGILNKKGKNRDNKGNETFKSSLDTAFLSDLVTPFSPIEKRRAETAIEFRQAHTTTMSDLLPWKTMIATELPETGSTTFNDLKNYVPENPKSDRISKFMHLLQMEKDGEIILTQSKHTSIIQIIQESFDRPSLITVKDKAGNSYKFNWDNLNHAQREKIITDAIQRKILCRSIEKE